MLRYTESTQPDATIFALTGDLSYDDYDVFRGITERMKRLHNCPIVLDLSNLDAVDSDGLSLLLISKDYSRLYSNYLQIKNPKSPRVARLCKTAMLHKIFNIQCDGSCGGCGGATT